MSVRSESGKKGDGEIAPKEGQGTLKAAYGGYSWDMEIKAPGRLMGGI